jgi:acyl carrier protein
VKEVFNLEIHVTSKLTELQQETAKFIIDTLHLDIAPESIEPDMPLLSGEYLGLDSIDILELAFAMSKKYGLTIKSGDAQNVEIFASLAKLSHYIHEHKKT